MRYRYVVEVEVPPGADPEVLEEEILEALDDAGIMASVRESRED